MLREITLPETNSSHLSLGGWKTSFLWECPIFRGYVSFRERNVDWFYSESSVVRLCDWIHPKKVLDLAGDKKNPASNSGCWQVYLNSILQGNVCSIQLFSEEFLVHCFFEQNSTSTVLFLSIWHLTSLTLSYLFQIPRKLTTLGTLIV